MNWIIFTQTPHDRVRFKTDEMDSFTSYPYKKFKNFILLKFFIKNPSKMIDALDKFYTIILDSNGNWNIIEPNLDINSISFEELYALNSDNLEDSKNLLENYVKNYKEAEGKQWQEKKKFSKIFPWK